MFDCLEQQLKVEIRCRYEQKFEPLVILGSAWKNRKPVKAVNVDIIHYDLTLEAYSRYSIYTVNQKKTWQFIFD